MNHYHTHIDSETKLLDINIKEIFQYKDLILLLTKKNFILTYKQTILGPIWVFLNPFITSIVYAIVFGKIAGMSTNGAPQLLFYLGGNAVWSYFSACITKTSRTFIDNANVFGKVYFPRICVPISTMLISGINFAVQMMMFCVFWVYYCIKGSIHPHYAAIPLLLIILLQLGMLGLGCGIIVSSLTTRYRDLAMLVSFGVQLWMYATPVVYPLSQLQENTLLKKIITVNPVTSSVELFRYIFLGDGFISPVYWMITMITTIFIMTMGMLIFNKVEKVFMDTI